MKRKLCIIALSILVVCHLFAVNAMANDSWALQIFAAGQWGDVSNVTIGVDPNSVTWPYPPFPPPDFSAIITTEGCFDMGCLVDLRPPGAEQEVWILKIMVGGPIYGGSADASLPGFFPVLFWDPNLIRPWHSTELRLWDANGPVIADMSKSDTYQTSKADAVEYLPELSYATFTYAVVFKTAPPTQTYCLDADGDAYGDPADSVMTELPPPGYVLDCSDCDDSDPAINPGIQEICDGLDNNCDGTVDEGCQVESWWMPIIANGQFGFKSIVWIGVDPDSGAYPAPPHPPEFTVLMKILGCFDGCLEDIRPPGSEQEVWYLSIMVAGPMFGGSADASQPGFFPVLSWDPNAIRPWHSLELRLWDANGPLLADMRISDTYQTTELDAEEFLPELDYATFTYVVVFKTTPSPCLDEDKDGFTTCDGDCDDSDPAINPMAKEICDFKDNDCDGMIDEGFDVDKDGFTTCGGDCDDSDPAINPDAKEICDGLDNDCDGIVDEGCQVESWWMDIVAIGQAGDINSVLIGIDLDSISIPYPPAPPPGFTVMLSTECVFGGQCSVDIRPPGAEQEVWYLNIMVGGIIFGGSADASLPGFFPVLFWDPNVIRPGQSMELRLWDANGPVLADMKASDTYQTSEKDAEVYIPELDFATFRYAVVFKATPVVCRDDDKDGFTTCEGDCDDSDPTVNPMAKEICDFKDNDCDGMIDEGFDADKDGFTTCGGDCDDFDPKINPKAKEICDFKDNDCDGMIDEGFDADKDGFTTCGGDCDDSNPKINPKAKEVCNGIDDNCDGKLGPDEIDADGDGYMICAGDCDDTDPFAYPGNGKDTYVTYQGDSAFKVNDYTMDPPTADVQFTALFTDSDSKVIANWKSAGLFVQDMENNFVYSSLDITDSSGTVKVDIKDLPVGIYYVTIKLYGDYCRYNDSGMNKSIVVYDPKGGSAAGGGLVDADDEVNGVSGLAEFSINARYARDGSMGSLTYQFIMEDLDLRSNKIDWLVIIGHYAYLQGHGKVNGTEGYFFRAIVKDLGTPGIGVDEFNIKIWDGDPDDWDSKLIHGSKNVVAKGNILVQ
ncbi:MAG: putative metal-binding motif-containing protein [bacterium]